MPLLQWLPICSKIKTQPHAHIFEKDKTHGLTELNYTLEELSSIKVQTLVLACEHEEFVRLDHIKELSQAIPNAQLKLIPDDGHTVLLEKPKLVNKAIVNFLKR